MSKKLDVLVAYSSIVLVLLTPFYYVTNGLLHLINVISNDLLLLVIAMVVDVIVVLSVFKIYYK